MADTQPIAGACDAGRMLLRVECQLDSQASTARTLIEMLDDTCSGVLMAGKSAMSDDPSDEGVRTIALIDALRGQVKGMVALVKEIELFRQQAREVPHS